ncbi:MAG: autotransporter-associated beta strand repeat-containing protein [Verrucomicrobiota bacterium]
MKPRSLRNFPRIVVCFAPLLACASASAAVATFNENSAGLTWSLPAVTNLLADPQVTTSPANANQNNGPALTSSSWATLTDGLLPTVDPNPAAVGSVVAPNGGNEVIFNLDVAGNGGLGFNITSFDSYCHWNDGGRNNQDYTLAYSVVGDETTFIDIGTISNSAGGKSTHSRIYDTTGTLATNVAAVRVHFNNQENSWVGYSEFILNAEPLVPAPVEVFVLNETMSGQPTWTLPAGTNLLDGAAATSIPALQSPPPFAGNAVSTNWATATNGAIGNSVDDGACVAPLTGGSVIIPLKNLGVNTKGYDLTAMDFYCAWADSGRKDIHFAVSYATYDAPGTFVALSNVDNNGGGNPISSTHSRLTPASGFLASNVVAIKLNFRDQQNNWVGYREFVASGTPSPINPPLTWTGSSSGIWDTVANNWTAAYDSLAPLNFIQTASNKSISVPAPITASSMAFSHTSSPPYAFSGSAITVTNSITSTGAGAATFANVVQAATGVALSGSGSLTFDGDLEAAGLDLSGTGTITLNADNDNTGTPLFTGTAGVSDGTLNIANNLAVKSATLSMTGGTANFTTATPSVAILSGTAGTVNLSSTALTVGTGSLANQSASFAGDILQASGSGSLIKDGASTLTLSGLNNYTGVTHVKGGTLQLAQKQSLYGGNAASWTSGNLLVDSGATLGFNVFEFDETDLNVNLGLGGFASGSRLGINTTDINPVSNFTLSRDISGGLGLYKRGSALLTLTGTNSHTGSTTISAGTLVAAGSGHVTLPGDVHMGDGSNNSVYMTMGADNQFGPTSVLHMNNVTFNGSNTKLQLRGTSQTVAGLDSPATAFISIIQNDDSSVPDFVAAPLLGASLTIDTQGNSYSFRGIIRNEQGPPVSLTKIGLGTQELINLPTVQGYGYTGPTTVNAGTLRINFAAGNSGFGSNITVAAPATLNFHAAAGNYAFDRVIAGEGNVVVDGTSAVVFTNGGNSFSNGVTVDGGFLALNGITGSGAGNGPGQTCIGGAMDPDNQITLINGGVLSVDNTAALGNSPVLPAFAPSIFVNEGSKIFGGTNTVAFVSNITLDGGKIEITNGANTGGFGTNLTFVGTLVVGGSSTVPAEIFTTGTGGNANASLGSVGAPGTTFQVANVTGDSATDLTVSSILRNVLNVVSPLTKTGLGTMELQAANTYTGKTHIQQGELRVNVASFADTGDVAVDAAGTLNLQFGSVDTVSRLTLAGTGVAVGIYGSMTNATPGITQTPRITGPGMLYVSTAPSITYDDWKLVIPNAADRDRTDDPDSDGFTNLDEFLFGTSPITSTATLSSVEDTGSTLIIRWCERLGSPSVYVLQESTTLENPWPTSGVTPTVDANQTGLYSVDYVRKQAVIPVDIAKKFARVFATE